MTQCWLAVGSPGNWETAFQHANIWGLRDTPRFRALWQRMEKGDQVFFYATRPVAGVIGYGLISTKFKQDRPLWPDEVAANEVIWPLRFEFNVEHCLERKMWESERFVSLSVRALVQSGFQLLAADVAGEIVQGLQRPETDIISEEEGEYKIALTHREFVEKLKEIGKLQNYVADKEYDMEGRRVDVVWRRLAQGVPTFVFEVQLGGDIYRALAKLKHAYDIWNSRIYLVASEDDRASVSELLAGTFHEIASELRFIPLGKVMELYNRKKDVRDLESELDI